MLRSGQHGGSLSGKALVLLIETSFLAWRSVYNLSFMHKTNSPSFPPNSCDLVLSGTCRIPSRFNLESLVVGALSKLITGTYLVSLPYHKGHFIRVISRSTKSLLKLTRYANITAT